jgi:hypothetical protein
MTRLELTSQEATLLAQALETYLSDLRMEIADTDRHEFREELKRQEETLRSLMERLRGGVEPAR